MGKVGYRFLPTEQELVEYFLYNMITENPILDDDEDPVRVCDLYGDQEPWDIWDFHGGNGLLKVEALYFFTRLKKLSPNGSRFSRKIASGAWQGEDGAKAIVGRDDSDKILGFRKRFRYENSNNSEQNGGWIMHEYTINSSLLDEKYKHKATDYVLCSMKKNESGQHKEKSGLGNKQTKSKQISETTELGQRVLGRKRKLKQADKPNNRDDRDNEADDCVQHKRLKAEQQALWIHPTELPSASNVLEVVESEAGTDSCSDMFEAADLFPDTNQRAEIDCIEYYIPEGHHQHLMSDVETEGCSAADLFPNTNQRPEVDFVEYYIPEGHQQHLMSEQDAIQVFEYEAETEPVFDFGGIFSNIGYDFDQVFTSGDLEFLGPLPD